MAKRVTLREVAIFAAMVLLAFAAVAVWRVIGGGNF